MSSANAAKAFTGAARAPAAAFKARTAKTCPACNTEIRSSYSFCRSCNFRLRAESATSARPTQAAPWTYRHTLRPWQVTALAAWEQANHRGVVEAATGTGKTAVAFAAIQRLRELHGDDLRVAIVVPTKVLARQWRRALTAEAGVPRDLLGDQYSTPEVEWAPRHPVLITILDTARTHLCGVIQAWKGKPILLVVDECHRAGSEHNARIFGPVDTYTLGLSATPERIDGGHRKYVYPGLGKPVFRYPLLNALDDGVLAPLLSINLYVDFTAAEQARWEDLRRDIADAIHLLEHDHPELGTAGPDFLKLVAKLAELEDRTAMRLLSRLTSRRELLASAQGRVACQREILEWLATVPQRALVFHETIRAAEDSHRVLKDANVAVALDHSKLPRQVRDNEEAKFRSARARVYVAVRTLDEGVDVPDAAVAVIAAGSRSLRQRIQRFGRVLRYEEDKTAIVVSVLVRGTPEEAGVGGRDASIVGPGRVRHHRWPGVSIRQALETSASSYEAAQPVFTMEEMISMIDLGLLTKEMANRLCRVRLERSQSGGYSTVVGQFAANAWHAVADVRERIGMPADAFDRMRQDIRRTYWQSLDPELRTDTTVMHGEEISACLRLWEKRR